MEEVIIDMAILSMEAIQRTRCHWECLLYSHVSIHHVIDMPKQWTNLHHKLQEVCGFGYHIYINKPFMMKLCQQDTGWVSIYFVTHIV